METANLSQLSVDMSGSTLDAEHAEGHGACAVEMPLLASRSRPSGQGYRDNDDDDDNDHGTGFEKGWPSALLMHSSKTSRESGDLATWRARRRGGISGTCTNSSKTYTSRWCMYSGWLTSGVLLVTLLLGSLQVKDAVLSSSSSASNAAASALGYLEAISNTFKHDHATAAASSPLPIPIPNPTPPPPSGVTLVSAFFPIPGSKHHNVDTYVWWMQNLLSSVQIPVMFYTTPDMLERIRKFRGDLPVAWNTNFTSPSQVPFIQKLGGEAWTSAMVPLDPERYLDRVPDQYGAWSSKAWFVKNAADENPFNSKYFTWMDAGGFREGPDKVQHTLLALEARMDALWALPNTPEDAMLVADANQIWPDGTEYAKGATDAGLMERRSCFIQGGFFAAKHDGVQWWHDELLRITALQSGLQRFAGKEQDTWTHVTRLNWPRMLIMNNWKQTGSHCGGDWWFTYEYWADGSRTQSASSDAEAPEYVCDPPVWNGPLLHAGEKMQQEQELAAKMEAGLVNGAEQETTLSSSAHSVAAVGRSRSRSRSRSRKPR